MFIITPEFDKLWSEVGHDDEELRSLQSKLLIDPKAGKVITSTNGLRKLRWNVKGKGKRSGIRILYIDLQEHEIIYLITLLKKNERDNLSHSDKITINKKIASIKKLLS